MFVKIFVSVFMIMGPFTVIPTGTNIMTRLMGLILSAIALEFIVDGIRSIFNYA